MKRRKKAERSKEKAYAVRIKKGHPFFDYGAALQLILESLLAPLDIQVQVQYRGAKEDSLVIGVYQAGEVVQ